MTTQQITTVEYKPLTDEQVELVRKTVARDCSPAELELFLHQCNRTGLDPLSRQIHATKRQGKLVIVTGIDGYRLIADRTGRYAGGDDPVYDSEEGVHPLKATVTVWKLVNGTRVPFTRSARWLEFFPGDAQAFMWKKMPFHMLGKVAESLALRAAFPQELSGVYTSDEMGGSDEVIDAEVERVKPAVADRPKHQEPAPAVKALPTGAEFSRLLYDHDAKLESEGLCGPGELVKRIIEVGVKAGHGADLTTWNQIGVQMAVDLYKRFKADRREAAEALNTPTMRPDATTDERDSLIRAIDAKRDVSWGALLLMANVPGLEDFAEPQNVGEALQSNGCLKMLTRTDHLEKIMAALEKPAKAPPKQGKRAG